MRLYTVEVSYEMVVWAKDEKDARQVARDHAADGLRDLSRTDLNTCERKYPEQGIPDGYSDDCCAYGGGDKSIGELLSDSDAPAVA